MIAQLVAFAAAGLATGVLSGTLGVGGGFILVPLLTLIGVPIHDAVGTSLAFIVLVSGAGAARHLNQSSADPLLAAALAVPGVASALLGAHLASGLDAQVLALLFGLALAAVAVWMLLAPEVSERGPAAEAHAGRWARNRTLRIPGTLEPLHYVVDLPRAVAVGLIVGFASGLLGVGGGFLSVPALVLVLGIPLPVAAGTSLLAIIPPAISGTIAHVALGNIDWTALAATAPLGILGALYGARLSLRIPQPALRVTFDVLLIGGAAKLLSSGVAAL